MPDLAELDEARAARWAPPPAPRSSLDFARSLRLPDGPRAGDQFEPDEPFQACLVREMDDTRWQVVTGVASSQRGKSLIGVLLPVLRGLVEVREDVGYAMPTADKLEQSWHGKLKPMIEGAGYGAWLPAKGPGARGGKPPMLQLRDPETGARAGRLYFLPAGGGGKETALSAVSVRVVVVDEADDLADEGHLSLAGRRTRSFGDNHRIVVVSTVNKREARDAHPVLASYEKGTRSRLWYPCPGCSRFQTLEWERVKFDDSDQVGYACAHCPRIWTDAERKRALPKWRLVHDGQSIDEHGTLIGRARHEGRHLSLLCWDAEFLRASLSQIVAEYKGASLSIEERGDHSAMLQFYHKILCRDYRGDIEELQEDGELTWRDLLRKSQGAGKVWSGITRDTDRAETDSYLYSRRACAAPPPNGCAFTVASVDVQRNRVYALAQHCKLDGTTYLAGWGYDYARMDHMPWGTAELFAMLERVDAVLHRWCGDLPLALIGLDVGDGEAEADLMAWLRGKRGSAWVPMKGTGHSLKPASGDIPGLLYKRDGLWIHEGDSTREAVQSALRRPNGEAGSFHIPHGLDNTATDTALLRHLCAEQIVFDAKTKKRKLKQVGRWDWLDCARMNYALMSVELERLKRPIGPKRRYGLIREI